LGANWIIIRGSQEPVSLNQKHKLNLNHPKLKRIGGSNSKFRKTIWWNKVMRNTCNFRESRVYPSSRHTTASSKETHVWREQESGDNWTKRIKSWRLSFLSLPLIFIFSEQLL
jgi:hypothetical protein